MKHKLLIALLSIALIPATSFAAKPVKIPEPGQAVWVDANGTMLGDVQTGVGDPEFKRIYFKVDGKFYAAFLFMNYHDGAEVVEFEEGGLFYDQPGCARNVYTYRPEVYPGFEQISGGRDGILYIPDGDTPQTVTMYSEWTNYHPYPDTGQGFHCLDWDPPRVSDRAYPPVPLVDTNIYTRPFRLKLTPPK